MESKQAAKVRVKRGARWLDENFPGWEGRINPKSLKLHDQHRCICGQLFKTRARGYGSGYGFAAETLFTEANSWVNSIIKMQTKSQGLDPASIPLRAERVSTALGFDEGLVFFEGEGGIDKDAVAQSDLVYVEFSELQEAWEKLLSSRASA